MRQTLSAIAALLDGELIGDGERIVDHVAPLDEADVSALSFLTNEKNRDRLATTEAGAVIVPRAVTDAPVDIIRVSSPERALITLLSLIPSHPPTSGGIHPTAVLYPGVSLGTGVSVGPYAVIGEQTCLDDHALVGAGVVIGAACHIGRGAWLYPGVTIYDHVSIGATVIIHSGAVIGSDGFGYIQDGSSIVKIPQVGRVVIEDEVEIGANTTVDRATFGETRIGHGTKIDNLVQIGHNVRIGKQVRICAQVGIAGSTTIDDGVLIAGQAGLKDHITIGENVRIGGQAGVTKSVPANTAVSGYPARPHHEARRIEAYVGHLPGLIRQIRDQNRRIDELERKLKAVTSDE